LKIKKPNFSGFLKQPKNLGFFKMGLDSPALNSSVNSVKQLLCI